jgi:hypothetical protein
VDGVSAARRDFRVLSVLTAAERDVVKWRTEGQTAAPGERDTCTDS